MAPFRGVPQPGSLAPDFTLPDTNGTPVRLADLRDTAVAVVFFPFAFSGICTAELCELRDNIDEFEHSGVRTIGVTCDSPFALKAWAQHEGYEFDLLSDFWPHGDVARSYGVFDEDSGFALRGSFLIDTAGIVRWAAVNDRTDKRDLSGYREAFALL